MRVDAVLAVAVAVLAASLLLHLAARQPVAYTLAFDCYAKAQQVAASAALNFSAGLSVKPPQGWAVNLYFSNGTVLSFGSAGRARCYAYATASSGGQAVLVEARG